MVHPAVTKPRILSGGAGLCMAACGTPPWTRTNHSKPYEVHGIVCRGGKRRLEPWLVQVPKTWPGIELFAKPQVWQHSRRPSQFLGGHEGHTELRQLRVDELEVGEHPRHGPGAVIELWRRVETEGRSWATAPRLDMAECHTTLTRLQACVITCSVNPHQHPHPANLRLELP